MFCDAKTPGGRAKQGSTEIKTLTATLVSLCLWGSGSFHYSREIHSNPAEALSANDMASQRTQSFIWGTIIKAESPKNRYWCLWPRETGPTEAVSRREGWKVSYLVAGYTSEGVSFQAAPLPHVNVSDTVKKSWFWQMSDRKPACPSMQLKHFSRSRHWTTKQRCLAHQNFLWNFASTKLQRKILWT